MSFRRETRIARAPPTIVTPVDLAGRDWLCVGEETWEGEMIRAVPPQDEWRGLTEGEKALADFFLEHLKPPWELYVQPRLNTIHPDIVVIHPQLGVGVYEVKDWGDGARRFGRDSDALWALNPETGDWYVSENPVDKVVLYRRALLDTYSRIRDLYGNDARKIVTAGVLMTKFPTGKAKELLTKYVPTDDKERDWTAYFRIVGREALVEGDLEAVLPVAADPHLAMPLKGEWFEDLRLQLVEPTITARMREELELDGKKRTFVANRDHTKFRRVRGAAGTGKSVLLASVAAQAALDGKQVAVLCFNITLRHYLRDLAVRYREPGAFKLGAAERTAKAVRDRVTFVYLHEWCEQLCASTGRGKEFRMLFPGGDKYGAYPMEDMKKLVLEAIDGAQGPPMPELARYDVICIDEGQDLDLDWWNIVRRTLADDGQAVLAADQTQSLYGAEARWTDEAMEDAGFRGRWTTLEGSHRLPEPLIDPLVDFCDRFLPGQETRPPAKVRQREFHLCHVEWEQVSATTFEPAVINAVLTVPAAHGLAPADVTFLVADHALGLRCIDQIQTMADESGKSAGAPFNHVFATTGKLGRRRKLAFWGGRGGIKGSTVHSFKGWESRCVILGISPASFATQLRDEATFDDHARNVAVYVALTRVAHAYAGSTLHVVCADPTFASWAEKWFTEGFSSLS